jgi:hypothetical protein
MKQGVLGAAVVVAIMFGCYMVSKGLYLGPALNWLILIVYVPFMWWSLSEFAKAKPLVTDFRTMVRAPFLTFVIINLGFYFLMYGLFLYDNELLQTLSSQEVAFLEQELSKGTGDPQRSNQIREQINYLKTNGMQMPLGPTLLQMCMGALGGFGLSAILTYLYQNNQR